MKLGGSGGSIFGQPQQQQQSGGTSTGLFSFGAAASKAPAFGAVAAATTGNDPVLY